MNPVSCGFIGLGLIGGSIAKALKETHKQIKIYHRGNQRDFFILRYRLFMRAGLL